jgi:hypothetical protein
VKVIVEARRKRQEGEAMAGVKAAEGAACSGRRIAGAAWMLQVARRR